MQCDHIGLAGKYRAGCRASGVKPVLVLDEDLAALALETVGQLMDRQAVPRLPRGQSLAATRKSPEALVPRLLPRPEQAGVVACHQLAQSSDLRSRYVSPCRHFAPPSPSETNGRSDHSTASGFLKAVMLRGWGAGKISFRPMRPIRTTGTVWASFQPDLRLYRDDLTIGGLPSSSARMRSGALFPCASHGGP